MVEKSKSKPRAKILKRPVIKNSVIEQKTREIIGDVNKLDTKEKIDRDDKKRKIDDNINMYNNKIKLDIKQDEDELLKIQSPFHNLL